MKKNQLYGIILMFMLIAIDACAMMSTPQNVVDKDLIKLSILGVVNFVFEILIWHKISKEWFSPYIAFFIVANIFCVGQMFGWAFGIDMGELDLLHYIPKINVNTLYHALIYSILGIACFHTGAIFSYKSLYFDMKNRSTQKNDRDYQSIIRVAKVLFVISFPAALFQLYKSAITSLTMGYGETYVISSSLSKVQRLLLYPSEWFPICLLIMYVAYQKNFRIKKILEIIIIAYLSAIMITGGRSGAVMFVLAFCITRHYLIKPFNRKNVLSIFLGGYLGLALLNTVSLTRTISNRTLGEVFSTFLNAIPNALGNI